MIYLLGFIISMVVLTAIAIKLEEINLNRK